MKKNNFKLKVYNKNKLKINISKDAEDLSKYATSLISC
jgi:hypothetical protein